MCPNCRAFITTSDKVCPYCAQQVGPRPVDIRQPGAILGGLIPHAYFTTILILLINTCFYAATVWYGRRIGSFDAALRAFGEKDGLDIYELHQWWRLVTAGFLHGGILHIAMNSWVFFDLGAQVEQVYGTPRFLAIYFAGTVGGFYFSLVMNPGPSIGASAGSRV
jgi:rhomboid protease GluP